MGREIRRVPLGWEHPRDDKGHYKALYDQCYTEAADEWLQGLRKWEAGEDPNRAKYPDIRYFWDWDGSPPDGESYRPAFESEPTAYQIYETVSEGTPTSPVFETEEEIVSYLVAKGHSETAARGFVKGGWAPSGVLTATGFTEGIDSFDVLK